MESTMNPRSRFATNLFDRKKHQREELSEYIKIENSESDSLVEQVVYSAKNIFSKTLEDSVVLEVSYTTSAQVEVRTREVASIDVVVPKEVSTFIEAVQLEEAFGNAVDLVRETVPSLKKIQASLRQNQDEDDHWIKLTAYVSAEPKEILRMSSQLLKRWGNSTTADINNSIRFHYKFFK